jgi:tetratricopeptide (TPR) repeat protein
MACALLFGGTLLLFSRATDFGFVNYDDPSYVTDNLQVQGGLSWAGLLWAFTAPLDYWHPLTWLSHMLDWQLYGPSASGHHLTSVLWHALNAVLAFLLFRRLAGGFWRSAFAAALFAWHPLRVESVVWITERKDVMSGCFFMLTLLAYARYVAVRAAGRPAWRPHLLALACFAAGLMSKPMLVTLPLVLLLLDFWPFARGTSLAAWRQLVLEKLPFFALSAAAAVATVLMQRQAGAFVLDVPIGARAGNAVVSLVRYLGKFVWPLDLVVCYPHPGYWPALAVVGASALAIGFGCLAWQQRRSRPWIATGGLWFLVTLLPVIGLVQVGFQAMADRYTYVPLLGVELALLWSLPGLSSLRARSGASIAAAVVLAACAARTWDQEGVWQDSVSLFEHAVRVSDHNDVAEDFLASALFAAGRFDEAAAHAGRARALNPRNDRALVTLAGLSERQGRMDEAMALYRSALALRPDNPQVQCQLGLLELSRGHAEQARV